MNLDAIRKILAKGGDMASDAYGGTKTFGMDALDGAQSFMGKGKLRGPAGLGVDANDASRKWMRNETRTEGRNKLALFEDTDMKKKRFLQLLAGLGIGGAGLGGAGYAMSDDE